MPKNELDRADIRKRFPSDVSAEILKLMDRDPPFKVLDGGHYVLIFCPCPMKTKPTKVSKSKSRANLGRVRGATSHCPDHPELQG